MLKPTLSLVGKITKIDHIPNADFVELATVDCKEGGIWKGIVNKDKHFTPESLCNVFLHDAIVPEREELEFMRQYKWRVSMRKFKGVPSECVIIPPLTEDEHGTVLDDILGVQKYHKPAPFCKVNSGFSPAGAFPSFIPITDEYNFQSKPYLLEQMLGMECMITLKYDGTSTTAFKYEGRFGVCSRNFELKDDCEKNVYWRTAKKYSLETNLPEGIAIQWETCGPRINKNNHHLQDFEGYLFSAIDIATQEYLSYEEMRELAEKLNMPITKCLHIGALENIDFEHLRALSETLAVDEYGKPLEGVVIRSVNRYPVNQKLSFKVLNLAYKHT